MFTYKKLKKDFVVVVLQGGLGNQLFQYSFGLYLKKKFNCKLIFDKRCFTKLDNANRWPEKLVLDKLNIKEKLTDNTSLIHFKYITRFRYLFGNIFKSLFLNFFFNIKIDKIFVDLRPSEYLHLIKYFKKNSLYIGHWESKKFADKVKKKLQKKFNLKEYKKNIIILKKKINNKSIMVHFSDTSHWTNYEQLPNTYYKKSLNLIKKKLGNNLEFHIFSKNLDFAKKKAGRIFNNNEKLKFIGYENLTDYEEFYLMRNYKYYIIPNSTFSWWAAYLSLKKNKLIIIPKKWYYNKTISKNLLTAEMIKI